MVVRYVMCFFIHMETAVIYCLRQDFTTVFRLRKSIPSVLHTKVEKNGVVRASYLCMYRTGGVINFICNDRGVILASTQTNCCQRLHSTPTLTSVLSQRVSRADTSVPFVCLIQYSTVVYLHVRYVVPFYITSEKCFSGGWSILDGWSPALQVSLQGCIMYIQKQCPPPPEVSEISSLGVWSLLVITFTYRLKIYRIGGATKAILGS